MWSGPGVTTAIRKEDFSWWVTILALTALYPLLQTRSIFATDLPDFEARCGLILRRLESSVMNQHTVSKSDIEMFAERWVWHAVVFLVGFLSVCWCPKWFVGRILKRTWLLHARKDNRSVFLFTHMARLCDGDRTKNWNCADIENLIKVAVMMPLREIIYQNGETMDARKDNKQITLVRPVQPEDFLSAFDAVRAVCHLFPLPMLCCMIISFLGCNAQICQRWPQTQWMSQPCDEMIMTAIDQLPPKSQWPTDYSDDQADYDQNSWSSHTCDPHMTFWCTILLVVGQ